LASDSYSINFLENRVVNCINIDKGLNLNIDKDKDLVIHDYGITAIDEVSSNRKITIPFNTDFEQIKKSIETLNRNTSVLTSDENETITMSVEDKNFLLEVEDLFKNKIEEYDKALNQITPEFRCTIDNYNIKFHKSNDVTFGFRLDFTEEGYILHQPGEKINDQTLEYNNKILVENGAQVPSNLKTKLQDLTDLEDRVKTLEEGENFEYVIDEIKAINP
jgi:hypothetical protein